MAEHETAPVSRSSSTSHVKREEQQPQKSYAASSKRQYGRLVQTSEYEGNDDTSDDRADTISSKRLKTAEIYNSSEPPTGGFSSQRSTRRTVSPLWSAEDEDDAVGPQHTVDKDSESATPRRGWPAPMQEKGRARSQLPVGRTCAKQRELDRTAVKTYVTSAIANSGSKFLRRANEQRWIFIQDKRRDKLRDRERKGSGSLEMWFPEEFAMDNGEEKELAYLRKQFQPHLIEKRLGSRGIPYEVEDDDEEIVVKREDKDEDQDSRRQATYNNDTYNFVPRYAATAKTKGRLPEPSTPESDNAAYPHTRSSYVSVLDRHTSADGDNEAREERSMVGTENEIYRFSTRGSATTPAVVGSKWRQYWETNTEGFSRLITPRTWKWNEKGQLVEWPPLDQISSPLGPRPVPPEKEERKGKSTTSALWG